jgi:hypothetical protein
MTSNCSTIGLTRSADRWASRAARRGGFNPLTSGGQDGQDGSAGAVHRLRHQRLVLHREGREESARSSPSNGTRSPPIL